ncbi:hypothetical protein CANINC_000558 [Pichia inconspicua]|uniref:Uncharacterized protein n=1 Tax=Pichia inconspicua TaxID=52247 RepID=A0A4T0X608_9ASCO|nr:hypothetical protein CANINC_000558 [[Candida] inconspicua]
MHEFLFHQTMFDIDGNTSNQLGDSYLDAPVSNSTEEDITETSTVTDTNNDFSSEYLSPDETTQIRVINDKFDSTYLPMIAESYSKIGKLSQTDKYKTLISIAPNLDFV